MIAFTVFGTAQPGGSKRAFTPRGWKRPVVVDANRKAAPWKSHVAREAAVAMSGKPLLSGPLLLVVTFYRARPKGHVGKKGNVLESAPAYPETKPDLLKTIRLVEDAMTSVVYRDDSQIVEHRARKLYGEPARVEVVVEELC